jgi:hypothetical protein
VKGVQMRPASRARGRGATRAGSDEVQRRPVDVCRVRRGARRPKRESAPQVRFHAASGKPVERVLVLDGEEIHRCTLPGGANAQDSAS